MRKAVVLALVFAAGGAAGWLVGRGGGGRGSGYPEAIHVTKPSEAPGKFAERYELTVTGAVEDGSVVHLAPTDPDRPSGRVWRVRLSGGRGRAMDLTCEERSR